MFIFGPVAADDAVEGFFFSFFNFFFYEERRSILIGSKDGGVQAKYGDCRCQMNILFLLDRVPQYLTLLIQKTHSVTIAYELADLRILSAFHEIKGGHWPGRSYQAGLILPKNINEPGWHVPIR